MDPFGNNAWDLIDYSSFIDDVASTDFDWGNQSGSALAEISASHTGGSSQDKDCTERECPQKRGRNDACSRVGTKACRERLRREKLNDRQASCCIRLLFLELSSTLEPGKPASADKLAILGDAIRVLNQLRAESQEYKGANEKLLEEIKILKVEKNELREEKLKLKADKARMEQQLKSTPASPAGFMPAHPSAYQAGAHKMPFLPSYGLVPMWQYLPPAVRDTSNDHELRPPAA
ncbi:hypothetical protein RJ639_001993 [Escallonia herrerae]|uniref:BHLH transcription factor n=1 Tax=Escallonia herrerae TaxID=1293975 RepID=A0AA88XFD3_9ASTE|nr:hypothetical protein RJ639_001993 [Escallonia herrerae]